MGMAKDGMDDDVRIAGEKRRTAAIGTRRSFSLKNWLAAQRLRGYQPCRAAVRITE
jgi:hypothetical protein